MRERHALLVACGLCTVIRGFRLCEAVHELSFRAHDGIRMGAADGGVVCRVLRFPIRQKRGVHLRLYDAIIKLRVESPLGWRVCRVGAEQSLREILRRLHVLCLRCVRRRSNCCISCFCRSVRIACRPRCCRCRRFACGFRHILRLGATPTCFLIPRVLEMVERTAQKFAEREP